MDARETFIQLAKLDGIEKMVLLLEEIAFNTSSKMVERNAYIERIYAGRKSSSTEVHGDVRAQSAARSGEVSKHDAGPVPRLRLDAPRRSPETKISQR